MEGNTAEVEEEVLSLTSIFNEVRVTTSDAGLTVLTFGIPPNTVTLTITGSYPNELPQITISEHLKQIGLWRHLISVSTPLIGGPMLYAIIDAARDWLEENQTKINHPIQNKKEVCKFFLQGKCRFGIHCINIHPGASTDPDTTTSSSEPEAQTSVSPSKTKRKKEPKKEPKREPSPDPKKSKKPTLDPDEEDTKKDRMRTATEVISRILWDPDLPSEQFTVGYLDRFVGIQEKAFKDFSWEDISSVGADVLAVPKHRIQYFKYKGTIVWDKRTQTDDFFGSRGGKTIDMIVEKPTITPEDGSSDTTEEEGLEIDLVDNNDIGDEQLLAHRHGNQPRPTHFVCLRVSDEEVKARVQKVVDHVTKLNPQLADGIIKSPSLHVTLCMVQLTSDEQIETAKRVFESCRLQFLSVLPRCVKIEFTGVDNFRERLIYIKVKPLPGLTKLVFHLIERFQEAGLRTPGNRDEYTPHITLVKLSRPMQRQLDTKLINPQCYQPFMTKNLGCQSISSIHLCAMHAPAQSDGFYLKYSTITNSLLGLPGEFAQLVSKKLLQLTAKGYLGDNECDALMAELQDAVATSNETKFDNVINELVRAQQEAKTFENPHESLATTVVIMRGLPGSGKSHLCTHCQENISDPSQVSVISADQFFTDDSNYQFNPATAFKAHQKCIEQFLHSLCIGKKLVMIDNTNSQKWEYTIYMYICELLGVPCHVLEIPCPSATMAERFRGRNQHKLQSPAVNRMLQRWEEDNDAVIVPPSIAYPRDWASAQPLPFSMTELCKDAFGPLPEVVKDSKHLVAVYSGVFLTAKSRWEMLSNFAPTHNDIHCSHHTLAFWPGTSKLQKLPIGKKVTVKVLGYAENSKVQACAVETPLKCENKMPHITVSTADGVPAKYANVMLENQVIRKCDTKLIEGIVGVVVRQATEEEIEGKEAPGDKTASMATYIVTTSSDLQAVLPLLVNNAADTDESTSNGDSNNSAEILMDQQNITKLYVFDFDGTLVIPPGPIEGRKLYEQETGKKWPHKGWLGWPESLLPPMKTSPGPALAAFRNHINRAGSCSIILTGRVEHTKPGLMKVLEDFQIFPDRVYFKPDITYESTAEFKLRTLKQLLTTEFTQVTLVKFWDDLFENLHSIKVLSQSPAMSNVVFDIIDATEMASTLSVSKHGKKATHSLKTSSQASNKTEHESVLQQCLANYGLLPTIAFKNAANEGIEFIANQFSKVVGYEGNPLNLVYLFGSYPLQRVSDIDMCLLASNTFTNVEWIEKMAVQLESCGVKYNHVGHSSRCPRLKILLMFSDTCPIEFDIVVALLPKDLFVKYQTSEQILATELAGLRIPGDNVSKVALSGPLFLEKVNDTLKQSCVSIESFGAVVEMVVQIFVSKREKGNACHCIRTFHIVQLLVNFLQQNGSTLSVDTNCDVLFKQFINFIAALQHNDWVKLFGEFVPEAYVSRIMQILKECTQTLSPSDPISIDTYKQMLCRCIYPPEKYMPVDIKISGKNDLLKWKAGIIVEARLPSYIRQIISHGLDVRPDGNVKNTRKYSFSVPPLKSAKDTLQQILRPFWVELAELRRQDGLSIQLNFDQPTLLPSVQPPSLHSVNISEDSKTTEILEELKRFATSKDGPKQLHLPSTLTSHARLLVHEAAEKLGLQHCSVGSGKSRHVVLEKH